MIDGMVERGYDRDFAERCFNQIEGFGDYGFPESHAASFALLVYVSAWMKCHHPAVFAAALLNSQPMGFYAPAQIVRDAQRAWRARARTGHQPFGLGLHAEPAEGEQADGKFHALRLGLRQIKGFRQAEAAALMAARLDAPFRDPHDVRRRSGLSASSLELLAQADAWRSLGLDRRAALWAVQALGPEPLPLFARIDGAVMDEPEVALPDMALGEHVVEDYASLSLSLKCHPLSLLREGLEQSGILPTSRLAEVRHGTRMSVAGLVLVRQRPGSASGVVFITLEDEYGVANLIVVPPVFEQIPQGDSDRPANRRHRAGRASGRSDPPAGRSPDGPEPPPARVDRRAGLPREGGGRQGLPRWQELQMIGMAAAQEKSGLTVQYVTILHAPTVMLSKPSPRRQTRCLQQVAQ